MEDVACGGYGVFSRRRHASTTVSVAQPTGRPAVIIIAVRLKEGRPLRQANVIEQRE